MLEAINSPDCRCLYRASAADIKRISGYPIAYWATKKIRTIFRVGKPLGEQYEVKSGLSSADNDRFLRLWFEVDLKKIGYPVNSDSCNSKWVGCNKGGAFQRWFGNDSYIINWENNGNELKGYKNAVIRNEDFFFKPSINWSMIASNNFSARYTDAGFIFDFASPSIFSSKDDLLYLLGFLNSPISLALSILINPTINLSPGVISAYPLKPPSMQYRNKILNNVRFLVKCFKREWENYEHHRGFSILSLTKKSKSNKSLEESVRLFFESKSELVTTVQTEEKLLYSYFIEEYNLQNELTPEVPLNEITLTCNPHYRYGDNKTEEELEALLLADTMREFISYAVGCMLGRYSLDKEGLILANQGDTLEDYFKLINASASTDYSKTKPNSFPPDEDNVIPILEGDWFTDDITERFREFLRVTFGDEHYEENLTFIEEALGKDIRKFFIKEFYTDHLKRYKKRPIYWLFSSPKGSFNALIYMHRYQPDTVSVILNDYLREFRTKLEASKTNLEQISISATATAAEKTRAIKEIEKLRKMIEELNDYEREVLYPLATQKVEIDLDDGVKVNYNKFGKALKKVPGLSAK